MAWVESLQKAIDYMEAHLLEPITIEDIAKQAHVSAFHFQRLFIILTDVSVKEYVRRRRMTLAAQELASSDCKIIDLAYKYGYDTPEAFAKAFRKQHGVTPSEARKGLGKLQSYNRLTIQVNLKGAEPMNYQLVERKGFQIVGVKERFNCDGDLGLSLDIGHFWTKVGKNGTINRLLGLNNGQISGLIGASVDYSKEDNEIEYWVGTEYKGNIPDGLSSYQISAEKWAIFEAVGPVADVVPKTWKKIYSEWFPSNSYEHGDAPSLEVYKSPDPTSPVAKTEIWVPVK
ncbi:Regulatory protein soxS [Chlamydia abortus]|uniref:HTH-type transcriptional regulator YdeE n=4 Tax=Paenibacillaceae TaxID=186822 RepID=A0ABQ4MZM7_9BACL|nr:MULTISPECIES: AraC family transcriptional regulator [Paenibacillaceae]MDU5145437.1 AraC family transcriptional regulator [Paenibacillus dendritiformis]SHE14607.1 Regulatory protein soxS [Chlamydia abortus]MDT9725230.1 AraC family transcriptional regulator [Xylanibacillus composti]GIP61340.1 putative HTH-type transcriptional regulator YdeE [Paenibacillus woosongensis]GIQ70083.1 putative HTH-type transcriptional regulator YdeE [Xylanibacillus composti]